ncbi:MAG: exodeoxyribonuclease III [Verrucomicrobiales bacterium]|nr:exodeoxyribonuclease III [Verrucomicrobiales bacterium]
MKLVTWNVNGLRSVLGKGFREFVADHQPDIMCLQEIKAEEDQVDLDFLDGYQRMFNPAVKKGYSGTAIFAKPKPKAVVCGMRLEAHDSEGRVIAAEFADLFLVNCYTPNSQRELVRLDYRQQWDHAFRNYLIRLAQRKPVLFCGDLNVAHKEIDLANPKSNRRNAGFTDEERAGFDALLEAGFADVFREFDPGPGNYTWWTYRGDARQRNIGWRIDYWCASAGLQTFLKACRILPEVMGSDHCPVLLETDRKLKF